MNEDNTSGGKAATAVPTYDDAVMLPCKPDQFRDFIAGLLGRPQTMGRIIEGPFDVTKENIISIHHLITQRISSQNDSTLMSVSITVTYTDNSSVTLNSIEDFFSYAEIKPLISSSVHANWIFLVHFQNKKIPEKQEIQVGFIAQTSPYQIEQESSIVISRYPSSIGVIRIGIKHTDRTWGSDIDTLITGYAQTLLVKDHPIRLAISNNSGKIGLASGCSVIILAMAAVFLVTNDVTEKYVKGAKKLSNSSAIQNKIDYIINIISTGMWTRYAFYVTIFTIFCLIASVAFGIFIITLADRRRPSFVLLTDRAIKRKDEELKKLNNNFIKFILSCLLTVGLAVLSKFVFAALIGSSSTP